MGVPELIYETFLMGELNRVDYVECDDLIS